MKNRFNQRIFKAVAMAIAATMAFSSPLSVVAEDNVDPIESHQNTIKDYGVDAKSSPDENSSEYHNVEKSNSAEANFKREESAEAQEAAAEAASIAAAVDEAVNVEKRQEAVNNADAKVDAAEDAAKILDGTSDTEDTEAVKGQKEIVQDAIDDAKTAVGDKTAENLTGVAKEVKEANDAAATANSAYQEFVTAAGNNAGSAWETVNGTKDKDGAADKLDDLKSDVNEYNAEVNKDQWAVYGDAFTANGKNWENFKDVEAVNNTTAELNEKIDAAESEADLNALKDDAKANVEAATQAVSDAKDNLEAAIAKYNNYAMKYNKPLYGKDTVDYTAEDVAAAGITQMSLDEINQETWDILQMQISEQEIGQAATNYVEARNAYYGAVNDIPSKYVYALQKLGIAYAENEEALALEDEIDKNLNGDEERVGYEWNGWWFTPKYEHVDGAVDYLEDATLTDEEATAILAQITAGNAKADEAIEKGEKVVNYDVNNATSAAKTKQDEYDAAQKLVEGTQGEIDKIDARLNGENGLDAQINAKERERTIKLNSLNSAKESAIAAARETATQNAYNVAISRIDQEWEDLGKIGRGLAGIVGGYNAFKNRRLNEYKSEYINSYVENFKKNDLANVQAVKDAQQEFNTVDNELNNKENGLKKQKDDLVSQRGAYVSTLSTQEQNRDKLFGELQTANNELKAANDALNNNAKLNAMKDAADADARAAIIKIVRDQYLATSDKINQTEFDEDLYTWSEDPRFLEFIGEIFTWNWNAAGETVAEIPDAKKARETLNTDYNEANWRKFVDKYEIIQWIAGNDNLKGNIKSVLKVYKQQLDEAENNYYDVLAQDAIQSANESKESLAKSKEALDSNAQNSIASQISEIQSRIDALNERTPYTDRSAEINALTAELNRLTFSVNGLIENNMFDIRNAQLAGSIWAIENAKKALWNIKMEALRTRGSVKKIDLVSLEWAIKWAEGEVYLATLAQTNAQAALDKLPEDQQNPVGPVDDVVPTTDDDDDDDTTGGGDDTTPFIPVAVTPATNVVTPVAENPEAPAVLGARTTRRTAAKTAADTETPAVDNSNNDNAAVAGAQKEETKTPEAPKEETKIEDNETALAATPELEEKGFAWWWLLILAAIAGVSVEEYARRKSNKAKAEAKDSTKINK
jgi:hypothetical protein